MKTPPTSAVKPEKGELNEFQAASLVGLSPKLLRWLTSYAAKPDSDRKLKAREEGGRLYMKQDEVEGFNDWLKLPWPSKDGSRPPVPTGIKREIQEEAGGECAICHNNANSCEAAHIVPLAKSKNNHPDNLIWLCANHHTKFDKHTYGPKPENATFVKGFKQAMTYYRRALWELQAEVTGRLFTVLKACEILNMQLKAATTAEEVSTVSKLATNALSQMVKMAPSSKMDPDYAAFKVMKPQFIALAKKSTKAQDIGATLRLATTVKEEFAQRAGYVRCPLCEGRGHYKGEDCPACGGEAELTKAEALAVDLSRYALVDCPLCHGSHLFRGQDCPACSGDGQLEERYADQVDSREWDEVDCPVCEGSGMLRGDICNACGGDRRMERQQRDQIDTRDYALIKCPLCKGKGTFRGDDCPECHGECKMERRLADQVDTSNYEPVQCLICKGTGEWCGRPCRACGGEGKLDRAHADQINLSDYKMIKCPTCRRKDSDFCQTCGGEGEIPRFIADEL